LSVDLMSLCAFVISVLLCGSVRKRIQAACWEFYLSQIFTDEQKPFCEQGEPTNAVKRRQISQSLSAIHQHLTINTQHPTIAETLCDICRRLPAFVGSPCEHKGFCSSVKICEKENIQQASCVLKIYERQKVQRVFLVFVHHNNSTYLYTKVRKQNWG
ncbi:hypothetical protein, partial [Prevotella jejuni]|uniref:hypothetical protein n=1 Tax=Prevotella jejuni TaxID=1177574 RepID=UPI003C780FC3